MPHRELMSWDAGRERWVKMYKGVRYSVSARRLSPVPTKEGSREQANIWWIRLRAEIDAQGQPPSWEEKEKRIIAHILGTKVEDLPKLPFTKVEVSSEELPSVEEVSVSATKFLVTILDTAPSTRRFYTLALDIITNFLGKDNTASFIKEEQIRSFHAHLTQKIGEGQMSRGYAINLWSMFGRFITYLWSEHILKDFPRNLKKLHIKSEFKEVVVFTLDELKTILNGATGFPRLCVLLSLNCGMNSADIGDLRQNEVGWGDGTIRRKRTKEKKVKNTPVVCYRLWAETFTLLKQFRSKDREYVFTTRNGKPHYFSCIVEGKAKETNGVKHILTNACRCIPNKPTKTLRATASSLLEVEYPHLTDYFLGHAPASIKDRHYIAVSQEKFDEALEYLRHRILG